jgi:hypothetical protein
VLRSDWLGCILLACSKDLGAKIHSPAQIAEISGAQIARSPDLQTWARRTEVLGRPEAVPDKKLVNAMSGLLSV